MSQLITHDFVTYLQGCLVDGLPVVLDEMVLAYVPQLDPDAPMDPAMGLPAASSIVHRQPVDQVGRINNNAVVYSIVMDTAVGDFSFNAIYLINATHNIVGMAVHKGVETKIKSDPATGKTGNSIVKSLLMEYEQAATATATLVDAGTWQIDYAARLRGMDDDLRLQALQFFGPATFYGNGFHLANNAGVYQVQPGVAYIGGLRAQLDEVKKVTPSNKPVGLWLDIHRAGSLLDAWVNHFTLTLSAPALTDYVDANGYPHHVAQIATINSDGSVTDLRRKRTITLTGDVSGQGILEDAQGVAIKVAIQGGSHRHPWSELDQIPAVASRWPAWGEVTGKPTTMPPAGHRHPWSELDQVPAVASRWPAWAEVTGKPDLAAENHTHPGSWLNPINLGTEDLDTLKAPRVYAQHANANASATRHYPENSAGALIVTNGAGAQQTYWVYNSSRVWRRAQYSTGAWTPWTREYNTGNKPTLVELGAAAVSHTHPWGQITGAPAQATRWPSWAEVTGKPTTMPPAAHTHTAAQGNADIVASGFGQVGTYVFARCDGTHDIYMGDLVVGSRLRPCGVDDELDDESNPGLSGTWKCMGRSHYAVNGENEWKAAKTLWIRIA